MKCIRFFVFALALAYAVPAFAVQPDEMLKDPVLEARARNLSERLRCMVCQNQSIDDSNAALARDLRILVRQRISAGDSDSEVLNYLVARYGEFVLLKPRFSLHTAFLWLGPPVVLFAGAFALVLAARRRRRQLAGAAGIATPLTASEEERISRLLDQTGP